MRLPFSNGGSMYIRCFLNFGSKSCILSLFSLVFSTVEDCNASLGNAALRTGQFTNPLNLRKRQKSFEDALRVCKTSMYFCLLYVPACTTPHCRSGRTPRAFRPTFSNLGTGWRKTDCRWCRGPRSPSKAALIIKTIKVSGQYIIVSPRPFNGRLDTTIPIALTKLLFLYIRVLTKGPFFLTQGRILIITAHSQLKIWDY